MVNTPSYRMEQCPKCKALRRVIFKEDHIQCVLCDTFISAATEAIMAVQIGESVQFGPAGEKVINMLQWKESQKGQLK